jgi:hypothetical protein
VVKNKPYQKVNIKLKCAGCGKRAETNLAHLGAFCSRCFCTTIEKRIRKYVRVNRIFSKHDRIVAVGELNHYLVPRIIQGLPVELKLAKRTPKNGRGKIVVVRSADDLACAFVGQVLSNSVKRDGHETDISIVRVATDRELQLFAKFRKIRFEPNPKNAEIRGMLDTLEAKHPETKFSILKSMEQLEHLRLR